MTFNLQKKFDCVSPCPFFIRPHSSREAADLWRKSDSSEELKGSSSAASNQSDWPLSPLMASEADVSGKDLFDRSHNASHSSLDADGLKIKTIIVEKKNLAKMPFVYYRRSSSKTEKWEKEKTVLQESVLQETVKNSVLLPCPKTIL